MPKYSVDELRMLAEKFYAERAVHLRKSTIITDRNKLDLFFLFLEERDKYAGQAHTACVLSLFLHDPQR